MIKLVCSDLDGTLIPYGEQGLSEELFELIKKLSEKGIWFCPASGRQYNSVYKMFAPVAKYCKFICENGAAVFDENGILLGKTKIARQKAVEVAWTMWKESENVGEVMLCGEKTAYLMCRGFGLEEGMQAVEYQYKRIEDPGEVEEEITKVSLRVNGSIEPFALRFSSWWKDLNGVIAAPGWFDITAADKGTGIRILCRELNILPEEVMAFGDNYNDVGMLDIVGRPCIMTSAVRELRCRYPFHADRPEPVLRDLLEDRI